MRSNQALIESYLPSGDGDSTILSSFQCLTRRVVCVKSSKEVVQVLVFSHGSIGAVRVGMRECDRYLQIHSDIPTLHFTLSPALGSDDVDST